MYDNRNGFVCVATADVEFGRQVCMSLEAAGRNALAVFDGYDVLQLAKERPDLRVLLLDTNLPGMNGYQVSRMIRESGNEGMAIILLVWFTVQSMEMALVIGCNEVVSKPVQPEEVTGVVLKWLEGPAVGANRM